MVSRTVKYFSLRKIMNSGQIFRMYEPKPGRFVVYSGNRRLELREYEGAVRDENRVEFYCSEEEFREYWENYFDLKRDYGAIVEKAREYSRNSKTDGADFLRRACEYGADIRVLKQDIWEMMISFIISQQKQIPSIRKCIEALCERFGEQHMLTDSKDSIKETPQAWYGFPTAEAIASAGPDGLKGLSLGYRERYIYETAVRYLTEGVSDEILRNMPEEEAKKYLCSFTGIGNKVADCISLFGIGNVDAFPIDVHIKDILYREFVPKEKKEELESTIKCRYGSNDIPGKKLLESLSYQEYMEIIEENFQSFAGLKGIIQQWIFAYEIR